MLHQFIMVVGSCPGVGKSTMTALLAEQLAARGVPTRCLLEDALSHLDVLAPIREGFQREDPDKVKILLTVAAALAKECEGLSKVHVIDAFLPGYHFLFGLYPVDTISVYNRSLYSVLSGLHPAVIHLQGDVRGAFRRAVEDRGEGWFSEFRGRINRHFRAGRYERVLLPIQSMEEVIAYFEEMEQLLQRMVGEWPGKRLTIETTGQTIEEVKKVLLDSLENT